VVAQDTLIELLWGASAPTRAATVLQGYVSHLRKALGPGVLVTRSPGYAVEIDDEQLDLHRFETLVEQARHDLAAGRMEVAAGRLRQALGLWRGAPLADFTYEAFAQPEIARLEELRLVALERQIETELALGRAADLVGELERLVASHPLRERLCELLMLALYRSGRQADALEAYRATRRLLLDDLGIDPGETLQELERAILRHDPGLDCAPTPGRSSAPEPEPERSIVVLPLDDEYLDALLDVAEALASRPPRELIIARLLPDEQGLDEASARLRACRSSLRARGLSSRAAAFTSTSPGADAVILASEQNADLLLVDTPASLVEQGAPDPVLATVLEDAPCDVAVLLNRAPFEVGADRPVIVPFGGAEHDWTAVELAAWIARARGASIRLLGTAAAPRRGRRDASRLLARASLLIQQVIGIETEPLLVPPGGEGVLAAAEQGGMLVLGLSTRWRAEGLGETRLEIVRASGIPTLLVRRGLRPGGLAPEGSMTRFTWTLSAASAASEDG
jgi:DNA-binding SARP family transcriptional activator